MARRQPAIIVPASGTRGARIVAGEPSIRIHGEDVAVNAEVVSLPGMSAHADARQIVQWLANSCSGGLDSLQTPGFLTSINITVAANPKLNHELAYREQGQNHEQGIE